MVKKITKTSIISLYLTDYGKSYYLSEIALLLKKPHQTIKPYVEEMAKDKALLKNERKKMTEYRLNFRSRLVYDYLSIAEKEKLISAIKKDMLLNVLFERLSPPFDEATFIIFGSAVMDTSKAEDIDLLVVGKAEISSIISEFEETYGKKIHKIQIGHLKELTHELIFEVYKKHLILNNADKVVSFLGGLYEKNRLV